MGPERGVICPQEILRGQAQGQADLHVTPPSGQHCIYGIKGSTAKGGGAIGKPS